MGKTLDSLSQKINNKLASKQFTSLHLFLCQPTARVPESGNQESTNSLQASAKSEDSLRSSASRSSGTQKYKNWAIADA